MNTSLTDVQLWVAGLVIVLVGLVGIFLAAPLLSASDAAAWVQAVFSVVAIFAAIWISKGDRRHDAALRRQVEKDSVISTLVLIDRGIALNRAISEIDVGEASDSLLHSLSVIADKLESLDLIVRPSPVLLRVTLLAANYLRVCQDDAQRGLNGRSARVLPALEKCHSQLTKAYSIKDSDYSYTPSN